MCKWIGDKNRDSRNMNFHDKVRLHHIRFPQFRLLPSSYEVTLKRASLLIIGGKRIINQTFPLLIRHVYVSSLKGTLFLFWDVTSYLMCANKKGKFPSRNIFTETVNYIRSNIEFLVFSGRL